MLTVKILKNAQCCSDVKIHSQKVNGDNNLNFKGVTRKVNGNNDLRIAIIPSHVMQQICSFLTLF
jgi:hypothetical protein